jgi:hypothetical protein
VIAFGLLEESNTLGPQSTKGKKSSAITITVTKCGLIAMFMIHAGAPATNPSQFGRPRTTSASPSTDLVTTMTYSSIGSSICGFEALHAQHDP